MLAQAGGGATERAERASTAGFRGLCDAQAGEGCGLSCGERLTCHWQCSLAHCRRVAVRLASLRGPSQRLFLHTISSAASAGRARQVERPADRPARQQTDRPGWLGASCVCSSSGRRRLHSVRAAVLRGRGPPYVRGVAAVWCAVAAVSRIALTAWWRAVCDEAHQSVQPDDEAPLRDIVFLAGIVTKGREVLELEHAILADVLPDSPAPAVCAAPAVQQSTHGGRRVVVGQGARPEFPILPAVVSKRRRDGQLSGRACSLESRYDRKGQFRDGVPPGLPGVKPARTRPPEPRATPVLGRIVKTSPQAVIHLVAIHEEPTASRPRVRGCSGRLPK